MIVARSARRSGITLTEILIAILIMGVGLISLATLFPLGLLRLREASRLGRSAITARSATDEVSVRDLLTKTSFRLSWYGVRDPFIQDTDISGNYYTGVMGSNTNPPLGTGALAAGSAQYPLPQNNLSYGNPAIYDQFLSVGNLTSGIPFCYDPLWRSVTQVMPGASLFDPTLTLPTGYAATAAEARFGSAVFGGATPYIAADSDTNTPSAHGLQRLMNFIPWNGDTTTNLNSQYSFTCTNSFLTTGQPPDVAGNLFTSIDDIVYNPVSGNTFVTNPFDPLGPKIPPPRSIIPELVPDSTGVPHPQADYRYSWFFTGRQADAGANGRQITGEIVVCDSRAFGFDPLPSGNGAAPTGEIVVEAIYGYGGNTRAVLLRWNNTLADPPVRAGGWIADTTYERSVSTYRSRSISDHKLAYANSQKTSGNIGYSQTRPYAGCYWYQVAKRTDPGPDPTDSGYRSMVVTLTAPVRYVTLVPDLTKPGVPNHVNVALVMPSVVNVFPRAFEIR